MGSIKVIDADGLPKEVKASGVGTAGDPFILERFSKEYYQAIVEGDLPGRSIVHKFGRNSAVGTSFVPVTVGGVYETPQVSGATALRVKAGGNANDTAAGSGAREVTFEGLDETGTLVTESVATAGASASAATTITFIRLFRFYVSASGTYTTPITNSHAADIVIENGAGGTDWGTIEDTDFSRGQSEIAFYTVPLAKTAYVLTATASVDSTKTADILFFKRENILDAAAPFSSKRVLFEFSAISGEDVLAPKTPLGPFPALTDIGFVAQVAATTAAVEIDFEILVIDD